MTGLLEIPIITLKESGNSSSESIENYFAQVSYLPNYTDLLQFDSNLAYVPTIFSKDNSGTLGGYWSAYTFSPCDGISICSNNDTVYYVFKYLDTAGNAWTINSRGEFNGSADYANSAGNASKLYVNNDTTSKIYVLGATATGNQSVYRESSVYMQSNVLYGAAWNDYAEFRQGDTLEPGKCVVEVGDDTLTLATDRMIPGASIVSDTFGFSIGETEKCKTPIAVSGRVLAYPYESREEFRKNIGRPVCSGPNGTVSIMTDEEYREKGYCALGIISAVPDYEEWGTGNVKVNNRVWIHVK